MRGKQKINWILTSGLGNQLYGYFAGQYFAEKLNLEIRYIHNPLNKKHKQHNSNIRSFSLNDPVKRSKSHILLPEIARIIFLGLKRRSNLVSKIENFFVKKYNERSFEPVLEIEEIKSEFQRVSRNNLYIEGYFQDFAYYVKLDRKNGLEIRKPSKWYLELKEDIQIVQPIIVHLRLGDYIDQPDIWGILDSEYYETSLKRIRLTFPKNEIWIFSDNFVAAKKILSGLTEQELKFIESSRDQDPAEVLKIMASGIAHVVSNSTFSLWAAMISKESKIVVVPDPVFRGVVGQARSLPNDWVKVSSSWASDAVIKSLSAI